MKWEGISEAAKQSFVVFAAIVAIVIVVAALPMDLASAQGVAEPELGRSAEPKVGGVLGMKRWSPYAAGAGIGILCWVTFLLSDKPIGVSTAYARTSGMAEKALLGSSVEQKPYYQKFVPEIGWEWMLVAGLFLGAFLSAYLSGEFHLEWTPSLWISWFGPTPFARWITALVGGILLGIGARWADGCTSGHGISGTLQLVVSSWIAVICFFIGGIVAAYGIYGLAG